MTRRPLCGVFDRDLLDVARRQHGAVSRRQFGDAGVSEARIGRAVRRGALQRLARGVYLVAPAVDSFETRCWAAQLWLDDRGLISGRTAGRIFGLARMRPAPIVCLVPHRRIPTVPDWIELHRSRWFDAGRDLLHHESGLELTTPERTLFALAAESWTQHRFDAVADDAWNLGLITPAEMADFLQRHRCRGKDGVIRLEDWVERALERARPTQSYFERDLLAELRRIGLPEPVTQHPLVLASGDRIHLDIAWPRVRLAIEPGHSRFHAPAADAARDLACAHLGWQVHRLDEHTRSDLPRFARLIAAAYHRRRRDVSA